MNFRVRVVVAALLVTGCVSLNSAPAQDWTAFRGSDGNGSAMPGGILSRGGPIELKVRWKKQLGSGYSSVVVAGDRVVTLFTDGQQDQAICLDRKSGEVIWQSDIGPHFAGENGSFDGPIATPLIHNGMVYALDPGGNLCCLSLEDGQEVWSKDLVEDVGSQKPMYGFATSPVVVGEKLVVQTGTREKSLAGMDLQSGEILWEASDDSINSQTPAALNFHGTDIVVAAGGKKLTGVDPANGNVLFEYEHGGGNGMAVVPVPLPGNRVVLTLDDNFSKAVSLRPGDEDRIEVSEEWQNRSIKNTYNVPALSGGNLFAYSTRILTCVDPETGQPRWKSRAPGDGFLITIDGHLIINTKKGGLHVAVASPDGFQPLSALELFEDLCWSLPAYSDDAVYLRSLGEIACVDIVSTAESTVAESVESLPMGPRFVALLESLQKNQQDQTAQQELITGFLDAQPELPLVEDDIVTFVYHGPGDDVAVASDLFGARQERKMQRIAGTDLFWYSMQLKPDQRANYMFLVDYNPLTDPRNSRTCFSSLYAGEMEFAVRLNPEKPLELSWFAMPRWKQPNYLDSLPEQRPESLVEHVADSELVEDGIKAQVYLPPGYDTDQQRRYRTAYLFQGPGDSSSGHLAAAMDNIFSDPANDVEPAILVLVAPPQIPEAGKALVEDLIPSIDQSFRTVADRGHRSSVGFMMGSVGAMSLFAENPELFGNLALYSPIVFGPALSGLRTAMESYEQPANVYIEWGRFDAFNPDENWDLRDMAGTFFETCSKNSNLTVSGGMVNDSTDWASWRNRYLEFLKLGNPQE